MHNLEPKLCDLNSCLEDESKLCDLISCLEDVVGRVATHVAYFSFV